MDYDTVIVRYGEIFLKSDYVRRQFTRRLADNVHHALESEGIEGRVEVRHHRLLVRTDDAERAAKRISDVYGVTSTSPAIRASPVLENLTEKTVEYAVDKIGGGSYAVRATRSKDFPHNSQEIERTVGAALKGRYGNRVDLTNPDVTFSIEVSGGDAYLYTKTYDGLGGLPYGTQGKVAAEVEDESEAFAAWLMMRRGCTLVLAGSEDYARKLSRFSNPEIRAHTDLKEAVSKGALGLVSAETLSDISTERYKHFGLPVYYPLLGFDEGMKAELLGRAGI